MLILFYFIGIYMLILSAPCTQIEIDGQLETVWSVPNNLNIKVVIVIRGDQVFNCGPRQNARTYDKLHCLIYLHVLQVSINISVCSCFQNSYSLSASVDAQCTQVQLFFLCFRNNDAQDVEFFHCLGIYGCPSTASVNQTDLNRCS